MELLEYVKMRWKAMAALFLVGLVAIVGVTAMRLSNGLVRSEAQLLVRPPIDVAQTYSSNPDRYITTELALLDDPLILTKPAESLNMSAAALSAALTVSHESGSDIVSLQVTLPQERLAVRAVNAVATTFVDYLQSSTSSSTSDESDRLSKQADDITTQLSDIGTQVDQAITDYVRANPGQTGVTATVAAPKLAAKQTLLNARLQQVTQSLAQLDAQASAVNPSRILRSASSGSPAEAFNPLVLGASLVGLVLALLVAAAVGVTFSSRVLGVSRYRRAAADLWLQHAVRLRGRGSAQYDEVVRDLKYMALSEDHGRGAVIVTYLPAESTRLVIHAAALVKRIRVETEETCTLAPSIEEAPALEVDQDGLRPRMVLLIDLRECEFADVQGLAGLGKQSMTSILPVLV